MKMKTKEVSGKIVMNSGNLCIDRNRQRNKISFGKNSFREKSPGKTEDKNQLSYCF